MGETFRLDALTQSDEFNEMAEYLFSIRWEEKKERFSVASLINYSDQS
jgi:hypothetical protein